MTTDSNGDALWAAECAFNDVYCGCGECKLSTALKAAIEAYLKDTDLVEALKLATHELNAIRARDGAPQHIDWHRGQPLQTDSCTHEWWNELTERCYAAIAKASPPLPNPRSGQ